MVLFCVDCIIIYCILKIFSENGIVYFIENGNMEVKYVLCKVFCIVSEYLDKYFYFYC